MALGELLQAAALRETREAAGVKVILQGLVKIEYSSSEKRGVRIRAVFYAEVVTCRRVTCENLCNLTVCKSVARG